MNKIIRKRKKVLSEDDDEIMTKTRQCNRVLEGVVRLSARFGAPFIVVGDFRGKREGYRVCLCVRSLWKFFRTDSCLCRLFSALMDTKRPGRETMETWGRDAGRLLYRMIFLPDAWPGGFLCY